MSDVVRQFAHYGYDDRIQEFEPDVCSMTRPIDVVNDWRAKGLTTVFMAGTFDLPTPNHRLGLAEARLMGAALHAGVDYSMMHEGASGKLIHSIMHLAASTAVKLMVTLDTDERASGTKAFKVEKGNCPRPVLSWPTRAHVVASYAVPSPSGDGSSRHMVDYITAHGQDACTVDHECVSDDNAHMVSLLRPDLVVVNAASSSTVQTLLELQEKRNMSDTAIGFTNEHDAQIVDTLLGGRVSGTAIVRRVRQIDD